MGQGGPQRRAAQARNAACDPYLSRMILTNGREGALQDVGEILDRLPTGCELHINDVQLDRLFGFAAGVSNLDVLRQLKAIRHAKEFAEEHGCVFVLPRQMPPKGIFVSVWGNTPSGPR